MAFASLCSLVPELPGETFSTYYLCPIGFYWFFTSILKLKTVVCIIDSTMDTMSWHLDVMC